MVISIHAFFDPCVTLSTVLWERAETVLAVPWAEMKKFFNVFLFERAKSEVGSCNGIVIVEFVLPLFL